MKMDCSVVTCLLTLLATTTTCTEVVVENNILGDLEDDNNSLIVTTSTSSSTALENNNPNTINIANATTISTVTASEIVNITQDTTAITSPEPTTTSVETTVSDNLSNSSQSESTTIRWSDETEEVKYPDQTLEEIENIEMNYLVKTTHGDVEGFLWRGSPGLLAYIDIPYGRFQGHFKPPITPQAWEEVHQEIEHKKRCPQTVDGKYVGELDCLTLSIFTPWKPVNASVLFYIHESDFASGSADPLKYGPEYLVARRIILVMPNYRLGPLGFLCLRNETAPGNAALKDLTLALEWTKNNIHAFGGDPYDITISGDGNAGALVGYLALSSKSNRYIKKVITESGSVLSHWALDRNPDITADTLAEKIRQQKEIAYSNTFEEADIETIVTTAKNTILKPCIEYGEDALIENTPWEMLHQTYSNITFMVGSANLAGALVAISKTDNDIEHLNEDFSEILPNDLHFENEEKRNEIGNRVKKLYFDDHNVSSEHLQELALCCTDCSYLWPSIRIARHLVKAGATIYLYEFSFIGLLNRELMAIDKTLDGAVRGDLIGYLFTQDGYIPPEETEERRMVNLMADLWASFIKTGKPTADSIEWDPLSASEDSEEVYLSIGPYSQQKRGIHVDRMRLWTEIYDEHFIEHNKAFKYKASAVAVIMTLAFSLGFCENAAQM